MPAYTEIVADSAGSVLLYYFVAWDLAFFLAVSALPNIVISPVAYKPRAMAA